MIVAGSVFALLLMGLAFDGFANPADEEPDDPTSDEGEDVDSSDDDTNGLMDLLDAGETQEEEAVVEAPQTQVTSEALSLTDAWAAAEIEEDEESAQEEARADSTWAQAESAEPTTDFVEIDAVVETEDGEDVAYVEAFDLSTDTLVLEFDGSDEDAPEIDVAYDTDEDAAIVMANGIPVTMVEGADGMTSEHVRIVMGGDETGLQPQVAPTADVSADAETPEPLTISPPAEVDPEGTDTDGPHTLPTADVSMKEDMPFSEEVTNNPLTVPTADDQPVEAPLVSPPALTETPELPFEAEEEQLREIGNPLEEHLTPQPQTQITNPDPTVLPDPIEEVLDPVEEVIETTEDLLPNEAAINAMLNQVTENLTASGGISEMLDARTDIDDAFGTGGNDAVTGSFNNEMITGGEGQDALFGDEGDDTLIAGGGNDELHGGTGNDDLQGDAGVDFLDGGEGNDTLDGGGDRDFLFGGEGDDVLYGGAANDFLQGGLGADMLSGGSGDDTLDGVYGDGTNDRDGGDTLWGGSGDDHIILGNGDMAHGGAGADTFTTGSWIETAEVAGHVADFDPSEDRIEVIFDPHESPDPTLEVQDFADGSGADIILNGEVILSVAGAQGLDPNMIDLQARA